ncbi:hypothetical protein NDU88_001698 [Pleurodeles waltl]|uniref:Uncharacterized protein n=1 Tax=Pleurodeles waltl TaxID=8319 RepID=A0AAV7S8D1_PLEWA|nr:hypothetical protein NDU88_001698 [Pleurodeles waltl]
MRGRVTPWLELLILMKPERPAQTGSARTSARRSSQELCCALLKVMLLGTGGGSVFETKAQAKNPGQLLRLCALGKAQYRALHLRLRAAAESRSSLCSGTERTRHKEKNECAQIMYGVESAACQGPGTMRRKICAHSSRQKVDNTALYRTPSSKQTYNGSDRAWDIYQELPYSKKKAKRRRDTEKMLLYSTN